MYQAITEPGCWKLEQNTRLKISPSEIFSCAPKNSVAELKENTVLYEGREQKLFEEL